MFQRINDLAKDFLERSKDKRVRIVSHHDTDGITSAAILTRALKRLDMRFSVRIVKGLDEDILKQELARSEREVLLFSDLASGSLDYFKNLKEKIFILDHHELEKEKLHENIGIINPHLFEEEETCSAGICYLFAKELAEGNEDLANLAMIGMIGDRLESNISKTNQIIINDSSNLVIKKGLLIFSATRPLRRSLEYSTSFYIPGVTGSREGVYEILREIGISAERSLYDLSDEENSKLVTAIMVRRAKEDDRDEIIGNIYLLKFLDRIEDVRELSLLVNSCSRLGYSDTALSFCLENKKAEIKAQDIYIKYKQELMSALKFVEGLDKIEGPGFVIINAKDEVKDAIIGTVMSILSSSPTYEDGTIFIGMAYNEDMVKVSARIAGRNKDKRNLKETLERCLSGFDCEVGGHHAAAGCLISKDDEEKFIESLKSNLEIEVVKV